MNFKIFKRRIFNISAIVGIVCLATCTKGNDDPKPGNQDEPDTHVEPTPINRELSPLAKKLIGKWWWHGYTSAPGDFIEFKDVVIDSLSKDSLTYREHIDSVKQSWCKRNRGWYEKNGIIYGICISNPKIIKLTEDTLIFRYYHYTGGITVDYEFKRAR